MDELRKDWKAVRATGRRKPIAPKVEPTLDLHESWAEVKGGKYPPYGYVIKWAHATAFAIFKYAIVGKYKTRLDGYHYRTEYRGVFYKTPGVKFHKEDIERGHDSLPRSYLCFTREEIERMIERQRIGHVQTIYGEMVRLHYEAERITNSLKYMTETLKAVRDDPMPLHLLERVPRKVSKRVT